MRLPGSPGRRFLKRIAEPHLGAIAGSLSPHGLPDPSDSEDACSVPVLKTPEFLTLNHK